MIKLFPALLEKEISFENENCRLRITCFHGDYLITVNQHNDENQLLKTRLFLHFGHRNTRFREIFYEYRNKGINDMADIFRELTFRVFGNENWSNNDRKRKGLTTISIKKFMSKTRIN
ncbi:hypothetical protein HQN90_00685 [Paenibacillus alba]|uniref:hypothetical protein n=1 Tax=Paenibacillus alba TaxID=1197127 RepID=UPI001564A264|nr:hypothetical protein [Paenibacillus alba]NQX64631.1 hypothetical protein [Paenibacillus alba]